MLYKNWKYLLKVLNPQLHPLSIVDMENEESKKRARETALSLIDLKEEELEKLRKEHPRAFTDDEKFSPMGLSILLDAHVEQCEEKPNEWDKKDIFLEYHGVITHSVGGIFHIPIFEFGYDRENLVKLEVIWNSHYPRSIVLGIIPDEIGTDVKFGTTFEIEGKELIVIENNGMGKNLIPIGNNGEYGKLNTICCVPAECIEIDCYITK